VVEAEHDWQEWTDQQNNRREAVTFRTRQVLFEGRPPGPAQDGSRDEASTSARVAVAAADGATTTEGEAGADDLPF
jgi:hypothetical protein